MSFWIKVIPPCRTILQPTCKPCHDRVVPQLALGIITDEMILAVHRYELNRLTQYLQGIVQLNTLADRHIRIHPTMQQQQRGLDFILMPACETAAANKSVLVCKYIVIKPP